MNNITLLAEPLLLQFDGVSDISNVTSRLITYITNTITSRLNSISRYPPSTIKINKLVNSVLKLVPDQFHIPGTNVTLEGGIDDHLHSTKKGYIMIPLDLWLQEDNHPLNITNDAHFSNYEATTDELQLYLSEYLIESLINVVYYYNNSDGIDSILKLPPINLKNLPVPLYSTEIGILLIGTSFMKDFGLGKECQIVAQVKGPAPTITLKAGIQIHAELGLDLECKKDSSSEIFWQVMTINTNYVNLNATITIVGQLLKMKINDADLSLASVTDSTIGPVSTSVLNALIGIFKTIVVGIINIITNDKGIDLNATLKSLGINFISFGKTTLTPFDEYFLFYTSLIYNVEAF